jgi:hypothetical protein
MVFKSHMEIENSFSAKGRLRRMSSRYIHIIPKELILPDGEGEAEGGVRTPTGTGTPTELDEKKKRLSQ